ncbi:MAG: asparagine synthase C-terminal domain-containing protein, partial [Bacteroidota bacterium]
PNTYIVSKATKNAGITMALSGIGGDELFAGYDVFKRMHALQSKSWLNAVPGFARKLGGKVIQLKYKSVSGNKIEELLSQEKINFQSAYPLNRSLYTQRELQHLMPQAKPFANIQNIIKQIPQKQNHILSSVSLAEIQTYMQNTLLRDTDQMSMAVALEVREPFLDYQLLEFVLGINDTQKFPHSPKKLLVDALGDLLPSEIVNRPKMGFTLPWQKWMKEELYSFCEKNMKEFAQLSFNSKAGIEGLWQKFLANDPQTSWSRIWHLVVLNHWLNENQLID